MKSIEDFDLDASRRGGRHPYCKSCRAERRNCPQTLAGKARAESLKARGEKMCSRCGEVKPLSLFVKFRRSYDGTNSSCLKCESAAARLRMAENPSIADKNKRRYREKREEVLFRISKERRDRKQKLAGLLGGRCADCGLTPSEEWPIAVFDFHHLDPNKKNARITLLLMSKKHWEKALEEAAKCVLLCANCHRRRHINLPPTEDFLL